MLLQLLNVSIWTPQKLQYLSEIYDLKLYELEQSSVGGTQTLDT